MAVPPLALPAALQSIGEALLIGVLVGFQRESAGAGVKAPGVRDFILIALTGGLCGLLQLPWLTAGALASITVLLAVFHFQTTERTGITTEMAAVATFALGFLTADPEYPWGATLSIATTIVVVAFLEAKRAIHKLVHETITETEFNDTLWFLAIIFIIYPILPTGEFGPFAFFAPRKIWLFVILISSISYIGYFLQKFLGTERGLPLTAVLGGLASTTAATASFARSAKAEGAENSYWVAAVIANTVHFPRVLAILYLVSPGLAQSTLPVLASMTAAGAIMALVLYRLGLTAEDGHNQVRVGNPFRLAPALKLGAVFTIILFFSKAAAARSGGGGVYLTSALGGSIDVDAVILSACDLLNGGKIGTDAARISVLIALGANAVLKTGLAVMGAGYGFGARVAAGFGAMLLGGIAGWYFL